VSELKTLDPGMRLCAWTVLGSGGTVVSSRPRGMQQPFGHTVLFGQPVGL